MAFNFDDVMKEAQKTGGESTGGGGDYKQQLLYPGIGTTTVKLFFNPKSNSVKRQISRHQIGDSKVPCLRMYGQECPICKALDDSEHARGIDLGRLKGKTRGLSYAQFVKADHAISDKIKPNDTVLFMYPWTVFKEISNIIAQATNGEQIAKLMASNDGFTINIVRGRDNKYSAQIDAFSTHRSFATDQEFENALNGLDDLNTAILPAAPDEAMLTLVKQTADEIRSQYMGQHQPQYAQTPGAQDPQGLGAFGNPFQQSPQQPQYQQAPPQQQYQQPPVQTNPFQQAPPQQQYQQQPVPPQANPFQQAPPQQQYQQAPQTPPPAQQAPPADTQNLQQQAPPPQAGATFGGSPIGLDEFLDNPFMAPPQQ